MRENAELPSDQIIAIPFSTDPHFSKKWSSQNYVYFRYESLSL